MSDEQYSFIPPKTAQTLIKWLAATVASSLIPAVLFAVTWVRDVATVREVDTKIEEQFKVYDPGSFRLEKTDPRRVMPPDDGYAYAAAACRRELDELHAKTQQQTALVAELYRNFTRVRAAEVERDARRRAAAAANAVREYDGYLHGGMQPDEAMRRALEVNPYTMR